jgi:Mrp family chromosome partitioning ATPase
MSEVEPLSNSRTSSVGVITRVVAVHRVPPEQDRWLPMLGDPNGPRAASFRVLRYRLKRQDEPKIIGVTSPRSGEGKTTTAFNLALAFAEDGRQRVLLVEANLHRPKIAEMLGFATFSCFARQLERSLERPDAPWEVVAAFSDNLHVLAVDPTSVRQGPLCAPAFRAAMRRLVGQAYAFIVVDCPAVLGTADVNVIADSADALLLTAVGGRSRAAELRRAEEHLTPANIVGTVLLEAR